MSSGLLELIIKVTNLGTPELDKANQSSTKLKNTVGNLCGQFDKLKSSVQFLVGGYFGLRGLQSFIASSDAAERSAAGFRQSLVSMGRYTPEFEKQMIQVSASLQKLTTFGDESIVEGMKFLNTYEKIPNELMPRVAASMTDIAALMGGDLTGAANMLGKASMGMTGELRRAGISVDDNTYKSKGFLGVLEQIEKQVKGQASALRNTGYGEMKAFGNLVDDVKEKLGDFIKVSLSAFFNQANNDLINLNEQMERGKTKFESAAKTVGEFALKIYNTAKAIVQFTREHSELVKTILYTVTVSYTLIKVFGLIKGAIMGVAAAFAFLNTAAGGWTLVLTAISFGIGALTKSYIEQKVVMEELKSINAQYANIQNLNIKNIRDEHYWNLKKAESLEKLIEKYKELKDKGDDNTTSQSDLKKVLKQIEENYPELISKTNQYGKALEINLKTAQDTINNLRNLKIQDMRLQINEAYQKQDELRGAVEKISKKGLWETITSFTKLNEALLPGDHITHPNLAINGRGSFYKSVWNDPEKQKLILESENTFLKLSNQVKLLETQIDILKKVDKSSEIKGSKETDSTAETSQSIQSTALERINYALEKWYVLDTKKTAADEQILSKYAELGKNEKIEKEPESEKIKYYGKLFDYEKNTEKFKSELEKKQKELKDESFEFITKAMLPEDTAQLEIDKFNLKNKYETAKSKLEKEGMTASMPALDTAYQVENDKLNKNYELKQIEKQAATRDYINQRTMDEDAYRFQKLRDEENKNYKERKDDYLNYSKDKEEIDAAHEKNLKRISDEETGYKKKKLEEEKQTLNNYLKENKEYQKQILQEELDNERDVLLKKYSANAETVKMIKKVYAEKSEALKEQFKNYTNFTASELMRMLELETTTAEQREKINKALNEKLRANDITASEAFETGWRRAEQNFRTVSEVIEQAGSDMANTLQSGISGFIQDSIKNVTNLKDAWINFSHSMRDAFVKAIAEMIVAEMKLTSVKSIIGGALGFIGGLFGIGGGANTGNYSYGAGDSPFKFASGGMVSGPGTGTSDDIFAKLSNGEFVVNSLMTQKFRPLLEAINSNKIPRFAKGGSVGSSANSGIPLSGESSPIVFKLFNIVDPNAFFLQGLHNNSNAIVNVIRGEAKKDVNFRANLLGRQ